MSEERQESWIPTQEQRLRLSPMEINRRQALARRLRNEDIFPEVKDWITLNTSQRPDWDPHLYQELFFKKHKGNNDRFMMWIFFWSNGMPPERINHWVTIGGHYDQSAWRGLENLYRQSQWEYGRTYLGWFQTWDIQSQQFLPRLEDRGEKPPHRTAPQLHTSVSTSSQADTQVYEEERARAQPTPEEMIHILRVESMNPSPYNRKRQREEEEEEEEEDEPEDESVQDYLNRVLKHRRRE